MLAQSNNCLSGVGQDIDQVLLKCALFQFFLYAPWLAIPIWCLGQTDLLYNSLHKNLTALLLDYLKVSCPF
jgi:hypothetical protein